MTRFCPGFDMNDYRFVSFRTNDTLRYVSNNTTTIDSLILFVTDFYCDEPYEFTNYSISPDYDCETEAYYQTNIINGISIWEHQQGYAIDVQLGSDLYSFSFTHYVNPHTDTIDSDHVYSQDKIEVDGIECFTHTITDLSGNRRFDSFTKIESVGIIRFHDKKTGKEWKLLRD